MVPAVGFTIVKIYTLLFPILFPFASRLPIPTVTIIELGDAPEFSPNTKVKFIAAISNTDFSADTVPKFMVKMGVLDVDCTVISFPPLELPVIEATI